MKCVESDDKVESDLPLPEVEPATIESAANDPRAWAQAVFKFTAQPVRASRVHDLFSRCLSRIYQIWKLFGFASDKGYDLGRAMRRLVRLHSTFRNISPMSWQKTLKFALISYWRYWSGLSYEHDKSFSEPLLKPGSFFPGRGTRFMSHLQRKNQPYFQILLNTMLISIKGAMPRPDWSSLQEAKVDWLMKIFWAERPAWDSKLASQIRWEVRDLLKDYSCQPEEVYLEPRIPSTSANYINNRKYLGSVGTFLDDPDALANLDKVDPEDLVLIDSFRWNSNHRDGANHLREWMDCDIPTRDLVCDKTPIQRSYAKFLCYIMNKAWTEDPLVTPVALAESLKVRMITKCPPYLMFAMNAFIDPLRKLLRSLPVFELTGTPQEETIMDRMFPDPTRSFCSGDYVGSTDNLHSWVSEIIVDELCNGYYAPVIKHDHRWYSLFMRSLTGFIFEDDDGKRYHQRNGQLMGSVSSFPVLCLANYALCRIAMGWNSPDWTGLLINGDDCVFECEPAAFDAWKQLGARMGLSPSPGKVDFAVGRIQMNSRTFLPLVDPNRANQDLLFSRDGFWEVHDIKNNLYYDFSDCEKFDKSPYRRWWKVPLVCPSMAYGLKRSSIGFDYENQPRYREAGGDPFGECMDLHRVDYAALKKSFLFELCNAPRELRSECLHYFEKVFMQTFRAAWKFDCAYFPQHLWRYKLKGWNIPRAFGGLGLEGEPSEDDLKLCQYMYDNGHYFSSPRQWHFHDLAVEYLSQGGTRLPSPNIEAEYGPLYWFVFANWPERVYSLPDDEHIDYRLQRFRKFCRKVSPRFDISFFRGLSRSKNFVVSFPLQALSLEQVGCW